MKSYFSGSELIRPEGVDGLERGGGQGVRG